MSVNVNFNKEPNPLPQTGKNHKRIRDQGQNIFFDKIEQANTQAAEMSPHKRLRLNDRRLNFIETLHTLLMNGGSKGEFLEEHVSIFDEYPSLADTPIVAGKTPLWLAANYEKWKVVKNILEKCPHADVFTIAGEKKINVLQMAIFSTKWDLAEWMLNHLPDPHQDVPSHQWKVGKTIPLLAANQGKWAFLQLLLTKFPRAIESSSMDVLLWKAAHNKKWSFIQFILNQYQEINIHFTQQECSTLYLAAREGAWRLVKMMIERQPHGLTQKNSVGELAIKSMHRDLNALSVAHYCVFLGVKIEKDMASKLNAKIEKTFERILTLFNERDDHAANPFKYLIKEVANKIVITALCQNFPLLAGLPADTLLKRYGEFKEKYQAKARARARQNTATLAASLYIWNNGLWAKKNAKAIALNLNRRILSLLNNYPEEIYAKSIRYKIAEAIGQPREESWDLSKGVMTEAALARVIQECLPTNEIEVEEVSSNLSL